MRVRLFHYLLFALCLVCIPTVESAVLTVRAVAINDIAMEPSAHVSINPGDSVTIEFYLSDWNDDVAGSLLNTYQVGLNGVESYLSGETGRLIPLGWDAIWPTLCDAPNVCPAPTPFCNGLFGTCVCLNGVPSCPVSFPTCAGGLCIGVMHDTAMGTFLDDQRPDFALSGVASFIPAVRLPSSDLNPAWGAVSTATPATGMADSGQTAYAGTHIVTASDDACGTFSFSFISRLGTFLLLRHASLPQTGLAVTPSVDTVTIEVASGQNCAPPLRLLGPRIMSTSLTRIRRNSVILDFDGPVMGPTAADVVVTRLTSDVCNGAIGPNLSTQLEFFVDPVSAPNRLIVRDPNPNTFQHATWYRIANRGSWEGVEQFTLDFRVLYGDVNNDTVVNATDLAVIFQSVPTFSPGITDANRGRDVNADGFINATDLGTVFSFVPQTSVPYPCQ